MVGDNATLKLVKHYQLSDLQSEEAAINMLTSLPWEDLTSHESGVPRVADLLNAVYHQFGKCIGRCDQTVMGEWFMFDDADGVNENLLKALKVVYTYDAECEVFFFDKKQLLKRVNPATGKQVQGSRKQGVTAGC